MNHDVTRCSMATTVCRSPQPTAVTRRQRSGCAQRSIFQRTTVRRGVCRLISSASVVVVVTGVAFESQIGPRHPDLYTRTNTTVFLGIGGCIPIARASRRVTAAGSGTDGRIRPALRLSPLYSYGVRSGPRGPNSDDVSAKPSHGRLCTCSTASSDGAYRNGEAPSTSSVRLLLGPRFAFSRARLNKIGALRWEAAAGGREHGPAKCGADGEGFNTLCFTLSGSALGISSGSELLATSWRHP